MKSMLADFGRIVAACTLWKILLVAVALAAIPIIPLYEPMTAVRDSSFTDFGMELPYWLKIWGNFDGFYYLVISQHGYEPGIVPFFPLYPILISIVRAVFDIRRIVIGQIISVSFFLAALLTAVRLLRLDTKPRRTEPYLFLALIFTYPTAFFYTAVYNDSLFFFLATLSILLARKKLWVWAALSGSLATLARLNGLVLFPYLTLEYLQTNLDTKTTWHVSPLMNTIKHMFTRTSAWKPLLSVLMVPGAFLSYVAYIHIVFTDWQLLFHAMSTWGQDRLIFPPQVVWRYFKILVMTFQPHTFVWWVALFEATAVAFYVCLAMYAWKKIRFSYWVFFMLSILIPWLTGTFQGMPRYGLHIYPLFMTITLWLNYRSKITKILYFVTCVILQILAIALFTRGIFVS